MANDTQLCIGFTHFDPRFAFFWSIVSHCAKEEAERLGVTLLSKPAPYVADQIVEIQKLLEQKVDALLITPIASGHPGLINTIETVNAAGIPVVALDSGVGGGQVMSIIRSDNMKGEEMAAEYIFERLGGKGKVAHLQGDLKVEVGAQRSAGFHNALRRYPGIELVFEAEGNWYRDRGAELTQHALAQHPDIQAVIAANDLTALGVSDTIANAGQTGKILVAGFDALPEALLSIYAGHMTVTIQQDANGMACEALRAAIQGIRGATVPSLLLTNVELITFDNLLKTSVEELRMLPGLLRNLEEQKRELAKANVILEQHRDQLEILVADRTHELARQKYILDTFIETVPDRIWFKDREGRYLRANQAHARRWGLHDPAEEIGKTDVDLMPSSAAQITNADERKILETGSPLVNKEARSTEPDGSIKWSLVTKMPLRDEHGAIIGTFGIARDITELKKAQQALAQAYSEISVLNAQLQEENVRMSAELHVVKQLQQMVLPRPEELQQVPGLDIAGYMQPADEVGGDYYDILHDHGLLHIGIGDVTGHGLESGLMMLMTQAAIRTLIEHGETDPVKFVNTLNRLIYKNAQRMGADKNLTFALVQYQQGTLKVVGQHEELLVVRQNGQVERLETMNLGFPVGLEPEISQWVNAATIILQPGDGIVLYTDGIPEAENAEQQQYGLDRLCRVVSQYWAQSAEAVKQAVVDDVMAHIGAQKIYDDITLVVLKQQ